MLNFGEKKLRFVRQKINIITLMLSGKIFRNEAKNHNPPSHLQVKCMMIHFLPHFVILITTNLLTIHNSVHCL